MFLLYLLHRDSFDLLTNIFGIDGDSLMAIVTIAGGILASYILMKEKLVKNEVKSEQLLNYIDSKVELLTSELNKVKEDIVEFKEINKETSKSLIDNAAAIRELKVVLNIFKNQFISKSSNDLDDL